MIKNIVAALAVAVLGGTAFAQAEAPKQIDVPAGDLVAALESISKQANVELVFQPEQLKGLRTKGVSGQLSVLDAIKKLLEGTRLKLSRDETTGAMMIGAIGSPIKTSGISQIADLHMAQSKNPENMQKVEGSSSSDPSKSSTSSEVEEDESSQKEAEDVLVTGSRIRSTAEEQTAQPVLTITQADIQRYGVSTLGEVLAYIPQATSVALGHAVQNVVGGAFVGMTTSRVNATLRGAPASGTLLLVNGRRAPRNGELRGGSGYDVSGIPLAAIDRIDVLLDGASSIYGADAVGGVINVILRKNYSGTDVRVGYENTFDTDSAVTTASLTHGFSTARFSTLVTAGLDDGRNIMMWQDRPFLSTLDRRAWGGRDQRSAPGGSGYVQNFSGNLPGLTSRIAAIPQGSDGINLTVQDFANAGPRPPNADLASYAAYSTPYRNSSLAASAQAELTPSLSLVGELRWGESQNWGVASPVSAFVFVAGNAPGNPFGIPVVLQKLFFDQPLPQQMISTTNEDRMVGLRGNVWSNWQYEFSISQTLTASDLTADSDGAIDDAALDAAYANPDPAQRPILLYDSTSRAWPGSRAQFDALLNSPRQWSEHNEFRTIDANFNGTISELWAGPLQAAFGVEYREELLKFPIRDSSAPGPDPSNRYTSGVYAELKLPLLGERQGVPLVRKLDVGVALRQDQYSDFPTSTNPRYSIAYRPVDWLLLRGSYGSGYKVPTLSDLGAPNRENFIFFPVGSFIDAARGNTPVPSPVESYILSNPQLNPERSRNKTFGLVVEVPHLDGWSLTLDYFDTTYLDRVGRLSLTDAIVLFPELIVRGPRLTTDPEGWLGPIRVFNDQAVNVAYSQISGVDAGLRIRQPTRMGKLYASLNASRVTHYETRSARSLPAGLASSPKTWPPQLTATTFLGRGPCELGVIGVYRGSSRSIPSALRWDLQSSYDFGALGNNAAASRWGRVVRSTRINLTIFNLLNTEPPINPVNGYVPDNSVVDSRLRRYSIDLSFTF